MKSTISNRTFIAISITLFMMSSDNNLDISGIYLAEHNNKTIDSLVLENNGHYIRVLRRKSDSSLVFINKGRWDYKNDRVNLYDYLIDKDQNYKIRKDNSYFDDVLMTASLPVKIEAQKTVIAVDHNIGLYYIKWNKSDIFDASSE